MDFFNFWTVIVVAILGHYLYEYQKLKLTQEKGASEKIKELEEKIGSLEKKIEIQKVSEDK